MAFNQRMKWRLIGTLIAAAVIVKDQWSKWWLMADFFGDMYKNGAPNFITWLTTPAERMVHETHRVTDYFNIALVWNPGISFGMLRTDTATMIYILSAVAVCIAVSFFIWMWREPRPLFAVCIGLIVGGALGNVLDRLRFGAVVDFLDFHIGDWHWPAFNVADASISVGVVLLIVDMLFFPSNKVRGDVLNETV